jgi:ribonucleotide reductase alpha subunit
MNYGKFTIKLKEPFTSEEAERLEERLRSALRDWKIAASIEDSITGNTTLTDDREDD